MANFVAARALWDIVAAANMRREYLVSRGRSPESTTGAASLAQSEG